MRLVSEYQRKSARARVTVLKNQAPCLATTGPDPHEPIERQRPKNNHNRMITGIGTPNSQSRSPLPIFASMNSSWKENAKRNLMFPPAEQEIKIVRAELNAYQCPVFGIELQGSAGGLASPFCNSSIECRSGERTKAIMPSRGGRLMVTPIFIRRSQVA
jgi:hypothetical protein